MQFKAEAEKGMLVCSHNGFLLISESHSSGCYYKRQVPRVAKERHRTKQQHGLVMMYNCAARAKKETNYASLNY